MNAREGAAVDVFSAFPGAIVSGVWQIAGYQAGTLIGAEFNATEAINLDVIVDEGDDTNINSGSNAQPIDADLLLYAKPEQLPTTNPRALVAGYLIHDSENDDYFAIVDASLGKNQDTGELEHVELLIKQTDVVRSE